MASRRRWSPEHLDILADECGKVEEQWGYVPTCEWNALAARVSERTGITRTYSGCANRYARVSSDRAAERARAERLEKRRARAAAESDPGILVMGEQGSSGVIPSAVIGEPAHPTPAPAPTPKLPAALAPLVAAMPAGFAVVVILPTTALGAIG